MTKAELDMLILQRTREQADRERSEKIQALKDKGILVQSAEEKERDQLQLESMLEKARQEERELADKEKADAKKDGNDGGDGNVLPDDDDEEGDWKGSDAEDDELELSGSEDENEEDEEEDGEGEDDEAAQAEQSLLDQEATEDADEDANVEAGEDDADDDISDQDLETHTPSTILTRARATRKTIFESDDEDSEIVVDRTPQRHMLHTPKASVADAFGFKKTTPAPLGLSQMFAGTMADSQVDDGPMPVYDSQQNSLDFLRSLPEPDLFGFTTRTNDSQDLVVQDSQTGKSSALESQGGMIQFESQSQMPSQMPFVDSQVSEFPELTQDVGFQAMPTGPRTYGPADSFSTVNTVPLPSANTVQSPIVKKKGRLLRKNETMKHSTPAETSDVSSDEDVDNTNDAFAIMRKASAKPVVPEYDKTKSTAKGMVEEQAEESEDEYAGLGGASDDESQGELDEETRKMIDDESNEKLNERDVAAYHA